MRSTTLSSRSLFLSTPSARRATALHPLCLLALSQFLSTPSARRATTMTERQEKICRISIHALREEGDRREGHGADGWVLFLSTPSARRATPRSRRVCDGSRYFYPRPPRGGRHREAAAFVMALDISIHALREEGDRFQQMMRDAEKGFLSTPSARRATPPSLPDSDHGHHFYPRPPRGGRRAVRDKLRPVFPISIHALREEGDRWSYRPFL